MLDFLTHVEPYVRVKRRQVRLAILMAERVGLDNTPLTKQVRREREYLAVKIKEANVGHRVQSV